MNSHYDVIIVGAGISGLYAGYLLQQQHKKILIIEARNRIGGRIHTLDFTGAKIDAGAAWIHGINDNPIYNLCQRFQLSTKNADYNTKCNFFNPQGKKFDESEEKSFITQIEKIKHLVGNGSSQNFNSLGDAFHHQLQQNLWQHHKLFATLSEKRFIFHEGEDLEKIAYLDQDRYHEFGGEQHIFLQGYNTLCAALAEHLPIQLNESVTKIHQDQKQITVITDQAEYTADKAIITVPIGVLKSKKINFYPELSPAKTQVIDSMGIGLFNKIIMQFSEPFWKDLINEPFFCYLSEDIEKTYFFMNMYALIQQPILLTFQGGQAAHELEKNKDNDIIKHALQPLRKICKNTPLPINSLITRWYQDPFAQGAYTYIPVGESIKLCKQLAKPEGRLFFAGEATEPCYYGNVHAALLSAERQVTLINNN